MTRHTADSLYAWLHTRIEEMEDGARLPTVRELMRQHQVGQAAVQEAFQRLKDAGLIAAQVGRGSWVTRPEAARRPGDPARLGSLLILSSAAMNERALRVQERLIAEVRGTGGKVVQLTWHDGTQLMELLHSAPSFDAAILQSHFETMPLRVLALLQRKTRALVVDGHSIAGLDIDRVGIDWEEAIAAALDHLTGLGHRRIRLFALETDAQPILHARRYLARLTDWHGQKVVLDCVTLKGMRHPSQPVATALEPELAALIAGGSSEGGWLEGGSGDCRPSAGEPSEGGSSEGGPSEMGQTQRGQSGRRPSEAAPLAERPTAVLFLGISDALGIRDAFARAGIAIPQRLSLAMLGHPDVATEHLGQFAIFGGTHLEATQQLLDILARRLANPGAPPVIRYLRTHAALGASTAPPGRD